METLQHGTHQLYQKKGHLCQDLYGSDNLIFYFGNHIGFLIHYVIFFCSAKPWGGKRSYLGLFISFFWQETCASWNSKGRLIGPWEQRVRCHHYQGHIREPLPRPTGAREHRPFVALQGKNFLPFSRIIERMPAISLLNGSCLFTQRHCLPDTHSTCRLGNWSQAVWGRDEIWAPVKVLLKYKPDIILLFRHHTVTYFYSLALRLVRLQGQCVFWAKSRAYSSTYRLSRLAVPVKSGNTVICEAPFRVLEGGVHEYYWKKIPERGHFSAIFKAL